MKLFNVIVSIMLILVLIGIISEIAMATPPVFPTKTPPPSSGGGGGGSSSGGSGPTFTPFVAPLLSSDGSTVGSLTGKTAFSVDLQASNNTTIGGKNYTVAMVSEMTQRPTDDARLDISIESPDHSGLPKGMDDVDLLGMVNISKHASYGWNVKSDTIKLTFNVPGTPSVDPSATYYLVRYDGSSYIVQDAKLESSDSGTMTFEASPSSDSGLFTVVEAGSVQPTPIPTPMPSSVTTSVSSVSITATPVLSSGENNSGLPNVSIYMIVAVLAVAVLGVMILLYTLYVRR